MILENASWRVSVSRDANRCKYGKEIQSVVALKCALSLNLSRSNLNLVMRKFQT